MASELLSGLFRFSFAWDENLLSFVQRVRWLEVVDLGDVLPRAVAGFGETFNGIARLNGILGQTLTELSAFSPADNRPASERYYTDQSRSYNSPADRSWPEEEADGITLFSLKLCCLILCAKNTKSLIISNRRLSGQPATKHWSIA